MFMCLWVEHAATHHMPKACLALLMKAQHLRHEQAVPPDIIQNGFAVGLFRNTLIAVAWFICVNMMQMQAQQIGQAV